MTQMAHRKFYDDLENHHEIRQTLKRNRYTKAFNFLYNYYFNEKKTWINSIMLQYSLCISNASTSYQILSSLSVLNLLKRVEQKNPKRLMFFVQNHKWWHIFKNELDKKK